MRFCSLIKKKIFIVFDFDKQKFGFRNRKSKTMCNVQKFKICIYKNQMRLSLQLIIFRCDWYYRLYKTNYIFGKYNQFY